MKIAVVLVTHSSLGTGFVESVEKTLGRQEAFLDIQLHREATLEMSKALFLDQIHLRIRDPIEGILILTDLYGSTTTNASLLQKTLFPVPSAIVTGMNLSMVLSALMNRDRLGLKELADKVMRDGLRGIRVI